MLKKILDSLDGLDDSVKALYTEKDGKFYLQVEDDTDVAGLKQKNAELLAEKAKWKEKQEEAAEKQKQEIADAVEAALKKAKDGGDIEALEASWKEKYDTKVTEMQGTIDGLTSNVSELTSGSEATKLVNAIGVKGSMEVLLPHVQKRLRTDIVDGVPKVVVLGTDGKPSATTLEELTDEFKNNEAFAPLIVGTKGNGRNTINANQNPNPGDKGFTELPPTDRLTAAREQQSQSN